MTGRGTIQAAVLIGVLALSPSALGEDKPSGPPSPERGLELAKLACSSCHLISVQGQSKAIAGVPSFRAIANLPEQTAARIISVLVTPHRPMPQLQLSRREIEDLVAYFDTLRKPEAGKPLLQKKSPTKPKPKLPSPS